MDNIYDWVRTSLRYVPSGKQRAQLRQEFYDHYHDRLEALEGTGMDPIEAAKQAVSTLGDPHETGHLLRAALMPWLAYVLQGLRLALVLLLLLTGYLLLRGGSLRLTSRNEMSDRMGVNEAGETVTERIITRQAGTCSDELDFGPFRVSCDTISFRVTERIWSSSDPELSDLQFQSLNKTCAVLLRFTGAPWYEPDLPAFRIVDDKGREILSQPLYSDSPQYDRYSWRELPWRTVVGFRFSYLPDDVEGLDFYLEHEGFSEKLRIHLGPWLYAENELPRLGDGTEALRSVTEMPFGIYRQLIRYRRAVTTGPQQLDGLEVSIPWARESLYQEETDEKETRNPVECVLMIRFDASELSSSFSPAPWGIEILDPEAGPEEQDLFCCCQWRALYADGVLYRLYWDPVPGADRYLLRFTGPDGDSCTMELQWAEEVDLP